MAATNKKMSLTKKVLIGMAIGILTGFLIRSVFADVAFVHRLYCKWLISCWWKGLYR